MATDRAIQAVALLYQGCSIAEIAELMTLLVDQGVIVTYVAANSDSIRDRSGLAIQPDARISDLDAAVIDVVIIPGGDPAEVIEDNEVFDFLSAVASTGGFVTGICAGVLLMAAAGMARGRSITHNYRSPWAPAEIEDFVARFWDGAAVEPNPTVGVVVDMPIVTALPNAAIEFAVEVSRCLGLYSPERAQLMAKHLRGEYVTELLQ